ncbi:gluconokinase-like protein [Hypoxylon sp. FL0543]|nr:gluconokinase-like protein [Hypoxylon sp. FL0543]
MPANDQTAPSSTAMSPQVKSIPISPNAVHPVPSEANNGSQTINASLINSHHCLKHHHIWVVTGPAGCGKSTISQYLASALHVPYIEGDEFHPASNVEKMKNGIPLADSDRWEWLTALRRESLRQLDAGNAGVVLACSALKHKYRDVIRVAPYFSPDLQLHFIYLHAPEEVLLKRVAARQGHFMGASMVHSQFDVLEPPAEDEVDTISIDVTRPIEEVNEEVLSKAVGEMNGDE